MTTLSRVEKEVAGYIARGYEDREIASARCCSVHTVRNAVVRVRQKLDARNRTQIAVKALYYKIVDIEEAALA